MNGIHDMGGMHGMGPIRHEADEAVFHELWEGRMHAISRAIGAGEGGASTQRAMPLNLSPRPIICA